MKNTLSEVKWYTPKQVAEILSVSEKTIRLSSGTRTVRGFLWGLA